MVTVGAVLVAGTIGTGGGLLAAVGVGAGALAATASVAGTVAVARATAVAVGATAVAVGSIGVYYSKGSRQTSKPLTGKQADMEAKKLGYRKTNYISNGRRVYYNPKNKTYISPDYDVHHGGVWKMAKKVADLYNKTRRMGTYDKFLRWIGK